MVLFRLWASHSGLTGRLYCPLGFLAFTFLPPVAELARPVFLGMGGETVWVRFRSSML